MKGRTTRGARPSFAAAAVGSLVEAWAEVRVHRTRVVVSLIGVTVAVASLTSVIGLGSLLEASTRQSIESSGGRATTLRILIDNSEGQPIEENTKRHAIEVVTDRYKISHLTENTQRMSSAQFSTGVEDITLHVVDTPYQVMHHVTVSQGSWFTPDDAKRLAPALIVNESFWEKLGSPDLRTHPTAAIFDQSEAKSVIIGVTKNNYADEPPSSYMLSKSYAQFEHPDAHETPEYEVWVPTAVSKELEIFLARDIGGALGSPDPVHVSQMDYTERAMDSLDTVRIGVGAVGVLILLLGALGLINIALVTVRQRIREIGIRRSFGATASRVFFAVMMESVVASIAAGAAGVIIAVFIVQNPTVQSFVAADLINVPAFPLEAALTGLAAATLVGAVAGLMPAILAVRFKVIDAIRY